MSATDELRRLLDERGVEYFKHENGEPLRKLEKADEPATSWHMGSASVCAVPIEDSELFDLWIDHCTPEQAIAATLGSDAKPCYATDYTHGCCKYSVNRGWTEDTKFYIPTLRHDTLTAEQVEEIVDRNCEWYEGGEIDAQAIADELNATLGGGECWIVYHYEARDRSEIGREPVELSCGHIVERHSKYCQECGRKIRKAVKR